MGSSVKDAAVAHLTSAEGTAASAARASPLPPPPPPLPNPSRSRPATRGNEPGQSARASRERGGAAPRRKKVLRRSPVVPGAPGPAISPFFNSDNSPQPTGPGCFVGQSACGLLGKVEGGDVYWEQLFAFGAEAAREILGHQPASLGEWWFWIPGKDREKGGVARGLDASVLLLRFRRAFAPSR